MPRKIENTKGRGKKFSKDYQPDPSKVGRPRNVFRHLRGMYECSYEDIVAMLTELVSLSTDELTIVKNDRSTMAIRAAIAGAILQDRKNGSLYSTQFLVERLFGKAIQKTETILNVNTDDKEVADVLSRHGVSDAKN